METTRDGLKARAVFSDADEFNGSWMPTWRARWSPKGQPVMMPTPAQPTRHYGIGAVHDHTGATVVLVKRHQRRREMAEWVPALVEKPPTGTI